MPDQREHVPVRTIMATIGLVLATGIALYLVVLLARIEVLLIVAAFFAVVLSPPVNFLEDHLHVRRGLATLLVFLMVLALIGAMLYAFIRPLVDQTRHFTNVFPKYVEDARNGKGTIGKLVKRYNVDDWVKRNEKKLRASVSKSGGRAVSVARRVANGLVAFVHSPVAGIGMIIVYVVYQQFENHVLQVAIMSRTVQINQLAVLVSVLIGVELAGLLGALLAIPAAGVIQVIARDIYDHRLGRLKAEPTVGEDEIPAHVASS